MKTDNTSPLRKISFKYRAGPAALRCLSEGAAYFARPSEFNDCLEAQFDHSSVADYIAQMDQTIKEIAQQRGGVGGYSLPEHALASFETKYACDNASFLDAAQKVGIYSTASRPDNQPMWAYYCDNSKGFCFELEWPDPLLAKYQIVPIGVDYSSTARIYNRADVFEKLIREEANLHPKWSMAQILEETRTDFFNFRFQMLNTCRAASIKHSDWAHENEVRFITPRAGPVPIIKDILKRVYFVRTGASYAMNGRQRNVRSDANRYGAHHKDPARQPQAHPQNCLPTDPTPLRNSRQFLARPARR